MKNYRYQAYGLTINSDIELPMLAIAKKYARTNVTIFQKKIPKSELKQTIFSGYLLQQTKNKYRLHIPTIGSFESSNGNQITYDPDSEITATKTTVLPQFILNECMAFLLKQRGNIVFRGMAINYKKSAVIFSGGSLTGKSLLAAKMQQHGYQVLCDDICAITPQNQLLYGYPFIKIWSDCFKTLEIKQDTLTKVRPNLEKYYLPLDKTNNQTTLLPVKAIYNTSLDKCDKEAVSITQTIGVKKMLMLEKILYGNNRLGHKKGGADYSPELALLAKQVSLNNIHRHHKVRLDSLIERIEESLESIFSNK